MSTIRTRMGDGYVTELMRTLREELDIGVITAVPGARKGIEAKRNIADLLDVEVPCLKRL